ncbi:MAG: tryptophan 2,3-dioxygenase [Betaproteobacteria bacterium]|nr:tryptophan 2,3-dioxygenase [Betaproteobacteria bacterium]
MDKISSRPLSYGSYLRVPELLNLQFPKSLEHGKEAHDELLFIVVHQAHELWFKQILHELNSVSGMFATNRVDEKMMGTAVGRLTRVTEIQKVLIDHLRILETMTPLDFLEFRDLVSPASGFQSVQFRILESTLGVRREHPLLANPESPFAKSLTPEEMTQMRQAESAPSLFALIEKWLERTPFIETQDGFTFWQEYQNALKQHLSRDREFIANHPLLVGEEKARQLGEVEKTENYFQALFDTQLHQDLVDKGVRRLSLRATHAALFINLYREEPILHLPFRLLTLLVDIDELLQQWRAQHAIMVHRMIGIRVGTGGSLGYAYLRATLDKTKVFADLFNLSTFLLPRSSLPALPQNLEQRLGFAFQQQN